VFIMLIFFIVTASFVKESGLDVTKPEAATATKQEKANILIAISANNEIWMDRRRIDIRQLRPQIQRAHIESPQGSVIIQADKNANVDTLTKVMDAANTVGVPVSLAAEVT
ncbi:MAG: biopolymer transporter ExbD, partial [Pseudomonadota bacterium]